MFHPLIDRPTVVAPIGDSNLTCIEARDRGELLQEVWGVPGDSLFFISDLGIVFREAVLYQAFGLMIGIPVALGLGVYLESQLFGLSARDPLVIVGAALALSATVMIAALVPARRAARVNPVVALRYE